MLLNKENFKTLCELAKKAAIAAGKVIKEAQGKDIQVMLKEGGSSLASNVVTQIDLEAQNAILEILNPSLSEYDLGLLTEESSDDNSRFTKDYFWCIDPLDGTLAFSRNQEGYSVSIALVSNKGESIIGVVYNPRSGDLYYAIKEAGAFKNDSPFKTKIEKSFNTLIFDLGHIDKDTNCPSDFKVAPILGGAVYNAIATIEHAPAIYFKKPKKEKGGASLWDFAASSVIQSEAGGYNSNFLGGKLDLNRKDSTFMNHEGIIYTSHKDLIKKIEDI